MRLKKKKKNILKLKNDYVTSERILISMDISMRFYYRDISYGRVRFNAFLVNFFRFCLNISLKTYIILFYDNLLCFSVFSYYSRAQVYLYVRF